MFYFATEITAKHLVMNNIIIRNTSYTSVFSKHVREDVS